MNTASFLQAFHPGGPWVLTSITVDRKGMETVTFSEMQDAVTWAAKHNGKRNLYFNVNRSSRPLTKKAQKDDITAAAYLHVDVDARAREDLTTEFERIKKALTEFVPAPTFIIFSGGGYQAFWQLKEAITDPPTKVEAYNKQLENLLGGDHCFNVDRIMRLPGTMNIPDAKKVERGRVATMAEVHHHDPEAVYTLANFTPAVLQPAGAEAAKVTVPDEVKHLGSVDELAKWGVPDRVKMVIVQGHDPDTPKQGDNSRSAWVFDVVCQLVRCKVPDEVIYAVLTDPNFEISSSILDKGSNARKYATRQMARAKDEVEDPQLRKLNERFVVIGNLGGKCKVVEEVYDNVLNRPRLTKQSFQDFRNRYSSEYVTIGKKQVQLGAWWLGHPGRRQYDYLVFSPNQEVPNAYNLWQGFSCTPAVGDKHAGYLAHLRDNICGGVEEYYSYLLGWLARAVQKPDSPGETAVVLRGKSGTGKSFFAKHFGSLWGRHFLPVADAKHLVGSFNAHLRDCVVLFGDEAFFAGDKKHESVLKTLITEESMMIEHKGVDAEVSPNFIHLILASNSEWVVPMGATERRFFVLDVGDSHQKDTRYFQAIAKDMARGGREHLLHMLMTHDLQGFDVRNVPTTAALMEQKMHSLGPMHEWWLEKLQADTFETEVPVDELVGDYVRSCVQYNVPRRGSAVKLSMFLRSVCPTGYPRRVRSSKGARRYSLQFPPLHELRVYWDGLYGFQSSWAKEEALGREIF